MATERLELVTGAQVASGNSAWFAINTISMGALMIDFTAGSGTITAMDLWLQGTDDNDDTEGWDIPADLTLKMADSATEETPATNKRDVVEAKATTTAEKFLGLFKHLPFKYVRVKWKLTGSTPSLTFSAVLNGK